MDTDGTNIEILEFRSAFVKVKFVPDQKEVKMSKRLFQKRVDCGVYKVTNEEKIPSII